ncbi:MAG: laminin B domain-containing protein [Chthoniobacteraceae bacterium]
MTKFAIIASLLIIFTKTIHAASVASTFDTGSDGWTAIGDVSAPVLWSATGGNPAGHIEVSDAVTGGVTYFVAPTKFLGSHSDSYGTLLTFDLRQSYPGGTSQFNDADIILTGGGFTLVFDTSVNPPNNSWASYSVLLTETAGWRLSTLNGSVPTEQQMKAVLSNLTSLRIRAEFQSGADTGSLDNVVLQGSSQDTAVPAAIYQAVEVVWATLTGKTYQVQSKLSLDDLTWTDFGLPVAGDGTTKSAFDTTRNTVKRFYRVIEIQ